MSDKPSDKKGGDAIVSSRPIIISDNDYTKSLDQRIARLTKKSRDDKFDPKKHKDTKRSQIALVFVWGYMITITLIIIGAPLFNAILAGNKAPVDLERVLSQVGSLIGAPLGFVIGYYFKEDK